MNDSDLRRTLKSVRVPERPDEYWEDFPARVRTQLRRTEPPAESSESLLLPFLFKIGAGFACLVLAFLIFNEPLRAAGDTLWQKGESVHRQLAALPRQLHVLMADEHGLHYLIAEQN